MRLGWLLALSLLALAPELRAQENDLREEAATADAREAFRLGSALARAGQWKEALAAFERSSKLRPHAVTTYNIAYCERSLGHYTLARKLFEQAFAESEARAEQRLPADVEVRAKGYLAEVERRVARTKLVSKPARLSVSVDGRPLERAASGEWLGGTRGPGAAERIPGGEIELLIDPGPHVVVVSHGKHERVLQVNLEPGENPALVLDLEQRAPKVTRKTPDRTWALLSFGVGASGVVVGALTGAAALNEKASLDEHCSLGKQRCDPRYQGDIDAMNRYATVSSVAFGVGAAGLGLGAYLWISGESRESVRAFIGPGGGGLSGRF